MQFDVEVHVMFDLGYFSFVTTTVPIGIEVHYVSESQWEPNQLHLSCNRVEIPSADNDQENLKGVSGSLITCQRTLKGSTLFFPKPIHSM